MTDKCTSPEGHKMIRIVFDGPPGPESCRFVDVETEHGNSISLGGWIEGEDGFWYLQFETHASLTERVRGFEQTMDALVERAERVQEGEDWDMAEFILRKRDAFLENEKDDPTATDPAD